MNNNMDYYEELTIKGILYILRRKIKMILRITLLVTAIVTIVNVFILKPVYRESFSMIIKSSFDENDESIDELDDLTLYVDVIDTYVAIAESEAVAVDASKILNNKYSANELMKMVTVETKSNTQIIEITIQTENKNDAMAISNAISQAFKKSAEELIPSGNVEAFLYSDVSDKPIKPHKFMNILLAFIISLLGSIGLAFLLYLLDDTIKTKSEAKRISKLPILGIIPKYEKSNKDSIIVNDKPKVKTAEAFRRLRTNIQYSLVDNEIKTILITSTKSEEGKSTVLCNLGAVIASFGKKVIVIDGDMRKPTVHKKYKISNSSGLSEVLTGQAEFKDVVHKEEEELYVLTSGKTPSNPSELLGSNRMKEFINKLRNYFDYVLIDTPPLMAVTDAQMLSYDVDGVLLVVALNQVEKNTLVEAKEMLLIAKANILGMVLNKEEMTKNCNYDQIGDAKNSNKSNNIKRILDKLISKKRVKKNNKKRKRTKR